MNTGAHTIGEHRYRFGLLVCGVLAASVLPGGCPNVPSPSGDLPKNLELEIGAVQDGVYHKLSDGENRPIIHGAQGGIHVEISLRLTGFPPGGKFTVSQQAVMRDTGEVVSPEASVFVPFAVNADGMNELDGQRVFLAGTQSAPLLGRQATLTVTVSDPQDQIVTASASVIITFVDNPI